MNTQRKGFLKRFLIIAIAGTILLVVAVQLSFTIYFNSKIKKELMLAVKEKTNNEYVLEIDKLSTNIFNQSVFISGFRLSPTENADTTEAIYFASAREINLVDCSLFSFIFRKKLSISKFEVVTPVGYLYRSSRKNNSSSKTKEKKFSLYALFSKSIHEIKIHKIDIENAHLLVYDNYHDPVPSLTSKDNALEISNITINKSVEESDRLFFADKVLLQMNRFSYTIKDSLYTLKVKQLTASYTDSTMTIDSVEIIPNYSKKQFSKVKGRQSDRMDIKFSKVNFEKMNVKLFFERNWFISKELKIDGLNLVAYRDRNVIRIEERIPTVQEFMKVIPIYAAIGKIKVENAYIRYEEINVGMDTVGSVSFNHLNATVTGFTSDSMLFASNKKLEVHASAKLMNAGNLYTHIVFPLNTTQAVFDCTGKLSGMSLTTINSILIPSSNIEIEGGQLDSMSFSFHANDIEAKGKMTFCYHDLKIKFLKKENHKAGKFQEVLSSLVHRVLLKENNPARNQEVRITDIDYKRDPNRFMLNYSLKAILSGIKPTIGLPKNLGK